MTTVAEKLYAHAEAGGVALRFEDDEWSYADLAVAAAARAALVRGRPHVGVLLDNVPEFAFWLAAAAVGRSVVVGVNPTGGAPSSNGTSAPLTASGWSPTGSTPGCSKGWTSAWRPNASW